MGAFSNVFAQVNTTKTNQDPPGTQTPDVVRMVGPVSLDQDLRNLPYIAPKPESEEDRGPLSRFPHVGTDQTSGQSGSGNAGLANFENLLKNISRPVPTMPSPLLTFEGQSGDPDNRVPDSDGDVGPNHYVQSINRSIMIFDKDGTALSGPTTYDSFFAGLAGTPCGAGGDQNNQGDPFTLYDPIADRWLISDFAFDFWPGGSSYWECIAVSKTGDPVSGGWWLYALRIDPANPSYFGDYPKFAMWNSGGSPAQNAYFLTVDLWPDFTTFAGVRVFALDRASMMNGGPANAIAFTIPPAGLGNSLSLLAANFRNGTVPPAGEDEFLLAIDGTIPGTLNQVKGWRFHVDFATPANSTLGMGVNHSPNAGITVNPFVNIDREAVPQPNPDQKLDTLGYRLMTPLVYQNRNGTESLWAAHTVNDGGKTAISWYQFNVTGGTFPASPVQQQHWTNGNDGLWRWMPSIAVDTNGNMAIGYSVSSSSVNPGIRYAGRLATDQLNNLAQGEAIMFNGGATRETCPFVCSRWGDYSMTTVDPADGTSFWHVNQYATVDDFAFWAQSSESSVSDPYPNSISHSYYTGNSDGNSYIYSHSYRLLRPRLQLQLQLRSHLRRDPDGKLQLHIYHWSGHFCARRC